MGDSSDDCLLVEEPASKSISCTGIPEAFLNKVVAKKHFSQFGRIRNFILRPGKYSCIVEYETTDEAENAFLESGLYNGIQFDISYTKEPSKAKQTEEFIDPDVQDELNAMNPATRKPAFSTFMAPPVNRSPDIRQTRPARIVDNTYKTPSSSQSTPSNVTITLSTADKATKNDLESILRKPAFTSEEKFAVLDARDKLIRLLTAKNVDIKHAVSTKGVCPDMCPEKERLMREAKHQVALFEFEVGSKTIMNHSKAVKQYSRSSADQESPLPHELRPEPVLKIAMTYLLQNIMDLCDVPDTNLSDWFHFLWDRTRGIRKDITQQELCSPDSVLLVEQCARFHIHCAARLIAEEPQVFDQKINTENLTKCLQSLKYMYHDLGLKMIRCPNEAEFRAYVVLLNLHDANFLWEVKQLRAEILHSPEIRFAINVYLAMESNNYVKFFSLVRSTTYMNACILLRYFTQVRVRAINVMLKSYVPRSPITMSIAYLTYILAFEDFEQCAQFLEYYGMNCERDMDRVIFDRNSFYYPDIPFIMDRAINVVEHKRHSSVGEAVYGGQLEPKSVLEKYAPHDSFDEDGYLVPKAWTVEDQNYFKPQARRTKAQRSPHIPFREDDNVFKIPAALPPSPRQSSPKLGNRLPQQRINSPPSFSSFTPVAKQPAADNSSTSARKPESIFKITQRSAFAGGDIFGGTAQVAVQKKQTQSPNNIFSQTGAVSDSFKSFKAPKPTADVPDATETNLFKTADSKIGSAFIQPSKAWLEENKNLFSIPNSGGMPSSNIFGKPSSTVSSGSSIFGNFSKEKPIEVGNASKEQSLLGPSPFSTNIFGGFNAAGSVQFGQHTSVSKDTVPTIPKPDTSELELKRKMEEERLKEEARKKSKELAKRKDEEEKERKRLEEEKERLRFEAEEKRIEEAALRIQNEIIQDFIIKDFLKTTVKSEIQKYELLQKRVEGIYDDILSEFIACELDQILFDIKTELDKNLLAKYFLIWRKKTQISIEQQRKIENTPVWLPAKPLPEIVPELKHPLQKTTLNLSKRYLSGRPSKIIVPPIKEDAVDVWNLVTRQLIRIMNNQQPETLQRSNIYWKCLISVPDAEEDVSCKSFNHWLNNVFIRQLSRFPRRNDVFFAEQNITNEINGKMVNICMRKLSGTKLITESQKTSQPTDLQGANSVLFFLTTKNLRVTKRRLESIIKATELQNSIGLIIYNLGPNNPNEVREVLNLDHLLGPGNVDNCLFSGYPHESLCSVVEQCLRHVASQSAYDFQLEMQQTTSFLNSCLGDELWQRIFTSISQNPTLLEAVKTFEFVVDYHNAAVDRLIQICSHSMVPHAAFPDELKQFVPKRQLDLPLDIEYFPNDWKSNATERRTQLRTFLNSLKIKEMINVKAIRDIPMLEAAVLQFVHKHLPCEREVNRIGYKIIQHILIFMDTTASNNDPIEFKEKILNYAWIDSIPIFTIGLLSFQYERYVAENRLPSEIIYDKTEFREYSRTQWWLSLNEELLKRITRKVRNSFGSASEDDEPEMKRQRLDSTQLDNAHKMELEAVLAKGRACLEKADEKMDQLRNIQKITEEISNDFAVSLYMQEQSTRTMTNVWRRSLTE